jgi:hypothetical protein
MVFPYLVPGHKQSFAPTPLRWENLIVVAVMLGEEMIFIITLLPIA